MDTQFKRCFKCDVTKPLEAFYKHAQMGDGHLNKCKECTKKDAIASRLARIEHYRQYDRMRASQPHRRAMAKRVQSEWKKEHPNRRRAQNLVASAVKSGRIKPLPCIACGDKAEAHHPDYDSPLDVVWLCSPHHKQVHAMARRLAA